MDDPQRSSGPQERARLAAEPATPPLTAEDTPARDTSARERSGGQDGPAAEHERSGRPVNWTARLVTALVALLLLVAGYVVAVAFLPRWWAQRIADLADGRFTTGIAAGLVIGFVFTALPLLVLAVIARRRVAWRTRGALVVLAVLLAVPNLITLGIVYGTGNAAHAGERILDVNAPGFRGATLAGAITAGVAAVAVVLLLLARRRRTRQLAQLRAELADRDATTVLPPDDRSGG